jgi:hypothetical protein
MTTTTGLGGEPTAPDSLSPGAQVADSPISRG